MNSEGSLGTRLRELALLCFKLGCIAFGGPAAHIAMLEDEVVSRRRWLTRQHFLDLVGATHLIPGPNSTETVMHVGYERAGFLGLLTAGSLFILPAAVITGAFAAFYVAYGALPAVEPLLAGIQPAVLAIIAGALLKLGKKAITGWETALLGTAVAILTLSGVNEIAALAAGGILGMLWLRLSSGEGGPNGDGTGAAAEPAENEKSSPKASGAFLAFTGTSAAGAATTGTAAATTAAASPTLLSLGLFFLKVGAVLYGSGYVLIAFLEGDLVRRWGWLTDTQLLDAVAVGQLTPGPVLSTATFVGYLLAGVPGAAVATVAIFLPSFTFVAVLNPLIPKLRRSPWTAAFLDAVNAAALGLMAAVTVQLALAVLTGWIPIAIAVLAAVALLRWKVNAIWLVLGGGLAGWVLGALNGSW
ncbi:MAG: chromate efflux transporter [Acidobacteriota bacterium]|nr:chromate efflux transporter [Acidobacteriota bacterium]